MNIYRNQSTWELVYEVKPSQMNPFNTMHGGEIIKIIDDTGGTCCRNWCDDRVSTATFHNVRMFRPLFTGDLLTVVATIIYSGHTSLTAVIYVLRHNLDEEPQIAAVAFATFVRMENDYDPEPVPSLPIVDAEGEKMVQLAKQIRDFSFALDKFK